MKKKRKGIMGASHIPYAQRLKWQQQDRINVNRNFSAEEHIAQERMDGAWT